MKQPTSPQLAVVRSLQTARDDHEIVSGLCAGSPWSRAALFDRYASDVERVIRRVLGHERHTELADVVHDTFVQALGSIGELRDPTALGAWMRAIAARTAWKTVRSRSRRRWLRFLAPEDLPEPGVPAVGEAFDACRRTYRVLETMRPSERVVFALRFIDGRELAEVAAMCGVSLSTTKRLLARAEQRFVRAALQDPVLADYLAAGGRWQR